MLFLEQRINALALMPKTKAVSSNSLASVKPTRVESVRAMQISDVPPKEVKMKTCIGCDENHTRCGFVVLNLTIRVFNREQ